MQLVTCYQVPPLEGQVDLVPDLTTAYKQTITKGLAPTGRVHVSKFWRLGALGDVNVFTGAKVPITRVRASIALLWDYSGSQSSHEPALRHSLSVIGSSLKRCGVDVWAGAYTSAHNGVGIFQVCGWQERWDHKRAATLHQVSMGGTPTGTAMQWVRKYVMPRAPKGRRMLLVCTDGSPGDYSLMMAEIKALRLQGNIVTGLYVGSDHSTAIENMEAQFEKRYAFAAATREEIPQVFNKILGRVAGEIR